MMVPQTAKFTVAMAVSLTCFSAVSAQELAESAAVDVVLDDAETAKSKCEIHIWPSDGFIVLMMRIGYLTFGDAKEQQEKFQNVIGPSEQAKAFAEIDMSTELLLNPEIIVINHTKPLDNNVIKKKKRLTDSQSACYSELFVTNSLFVEDWVWGNRFKTHYVYRDFGSDQEYRFRYNNWGGNIFKSVKRKEGESDEAYNFRVAANARGTFSENFLEFTKNARSKINRERQKAR